MSKSKPSTLNMKTAHDGHYTTWDPAIQSRWFLYINVTKKNTQVEKITKADPSSNLRFAYKYMMSL